MRIVKREIFAELEKVMPAEEIVVLTGCRQSGKTTALRYLFEKVPGSNKLFLDLENVINRKYFEEEDYEKVKAAFEFRGLDFSAKPHIFLDEIQYVKNLPSVAKYLKDHYAVKFFLTGSASFYLKNLFSESLSGRKFIFDIHPLTFKEFLIFKGRAPEKFTSKSRALDAQIESLFLEYMNFGGFPGVVLKASQAEKKKKLQDIFSSYFEMEVEKLRDFAKLKAVRETLFLLFSRCGSLLDIGRLAAELGISRITLKEYLDFFEKTFFFDFIKPFSSSKDVEIRKRAKVYPVDVGLAREMGLQDAGALFESAIYQNIRVRDTVNYYRRKNGAEIDFILNKKEAIEIKQFCQQRDVNTLKRLAGSVKALGDYRVVTLRRQEAYPRHVEWAGHFCLRRA
jgi:predicted AAA+ superfamily ATPase